MHTIKNQSLFSSPCNILQFPTQKHQSLVDIYTEKLQSELEDILKENHLLAAELLSLV